MTAIQAGVDMILMPEDFQSAYQGVMDAVTGGTITEDRINESVARIIKVKTQQCSIITLYFLKLLCYSVTMVR